MTINSDIVILIDPTVILENAGYSVTIANKNADRITLRNFTNPRRTDEERLEMARLFARRLTQFFFSISSISVMTKES